MTQDTQKIIDQANDVLVKTYTAQPVVLSHGKGSYAWDIDGKQYIDFAVGIAVASLGHANPAMLKTIREQSERLMACQASYVTEPKLACAQTLIDNSCFDLVYFGNSGTESVEAALKCARKWAYDEKGEDCNEIIAFRSSFHGRTYGSASVTEKFHSQPFFGPYLPNVKWATFNDFDSVKALVNKNTAAIIIEPVQGEGGVTPADPCFLMQLRALCDAENVCLIFDEVQAGMGRLGTFFAYESFHCCGAVLTDPNACAPAKGIPVEPDIACLAKGMGGGFPVGAMVAKEKFGKAIVVGTHGTTYGGNPLATAVANTVMTEMLKDGFLEHTRAMATHLMNGLKDIQRRTNKITDIRGKGLMIGIDTTIDRGQLLLALQKNGFMCTGAGKETVRLTPPLNISKDELDEGLAILEKTLQEEG